MVQAYYSPPYDAASTARYEENHSKKPFEKHLLSLKFLSLFKQRILTFLM